MEQKVIERFGKKIFYRTEGTGQPVMLLHGFGEDGHVWDNQVAALKKNYYFRFTGIGPVRFDRRRKYGRHG
jgi:pimeloyl-ACP methyl ester carboxylesterase